MALLNCHYESVGSEVDIVSIYDLLSFAEFYLGNTKSAAMYTEKLLQHSTYVDTFLCGLQ